VAAAIHAGRQGTALHITSKVLRRMSEAFGSQLCDLLIAIGPCIGPCCYEIDERVFLPEWKPFSAPRGGRNWMLDLASINRAEMERQGIDKTQIFTVEICTACRKDLLFSYRREGMTGRQLSFIGITEDHGTLEGWKDGILGEPQNKNKTGSPGCCHPEFVSGSHNIDF